MPTIILLTLSNIFMTFAWYGHLKYKQAPILQVIFICWLIALPEYILQVPANRIGSYQFSPVQLKTIQEIISLSVFCIFTSFYFGENLKWNHFVGFGFIILAVYFIFKKF